MLKDFRRYVLGLPAVAHTANGERIDALKVLLVQFAVTSRISLRSLDQQAFLIY